MAKKNSGKAPAYQMYPKDWNEDTDLKMCSYAAEGLWIRLSNTSYEMPVKGVFIRRLNGCLDGVETELKAGLTPLKLSEIADLVRGSTREKMRLLNELFANNVLKVFEDGEYKGAFYVKRIYRDMRLRDIRKNAGSKGGNPNLFDDLVNQNPNQKEETKDKQKSTPSSSSSSSTSVYKEKYKKEMTTFEEARVLYPGTKRGLETEFEYFTGTHRHWREILPLLKLAIEKQIAQRQQLKSQNVFVAEWKHFKSWLYNRYWELDIGSGGGGEEPENGIYGTHPASPEEVAALKAEGLI